MIYNDHMDEFFLDAYPTFALGVAETYPVADEGFGARPFPPLPGDAKLGWHIARSLVADEFDITICQDLEVDHGVISPLPMVDFSEGEGGWKIPIVPLAVNVILHPLPSPLRCWKLGQALRRAILSYPERPRRRRRRHRRPVAPADRPALWPVDPRLGPGVHAPARRGARVADAATRTRS